MSFSLAGGFISTEAKTGTSSVMDRGRKPIDLGQPKLKNSLLEFFFWLFHFDSRRHQNPQVFSYTVYIVSQYGQFKFAYRVLSCRNRLFLHFKTKKRRGEYILYILPPHFQLDREFVTSGTVTTHPPFSPPGSNQIKKELCCSLAAFSERRCFSLFCFVCGFCLFGSCAFCGLALMMSELTGGKDSQSGRTCAGWVVRDCALHNPPPPPYIPPVSIVYDLYCAARVCVSLSLQWTNNIVDALRHPIFSMWLSTIKTSGSWSLE